MLSSTGIILALIGSADAGPVDLYGFGARQMGRGAGGVALTDEPAGVFLNPAGLQGMECSQAMIGYALLRSEFEPVPDVYWDTNLDGRIDDTDDPLSVGPHYDRADGIQFALGRPVGRRFGLAIAGFVPVDRLLRIHTFEPAIPTYFMYENRPHRYEIALGFGWEQLPGLSIGGGVEMLARARYHIAMTFDAHVRGATEDDQQLGDLVGDITMDTHEMTLDLVPSFAPLIGLNWDVGRTVPALDGLTLAASYRGAVGLPVEVSVDVQANFHVEDLGELEPMILTVLLPVRLDVYDHYVPERYALGLAWETGETLTVYADGYRVSWDKMRINVAQVYGSELSSQVITLKDPTVADGNGYEATLRPTLAVHTGAEVHLPPWEAGGAVGTFQLTLRAGWAYEPTPLVSQGSSSAFLDADRMVFTGGMGLAHGDPFSLIEGPVRWDTFFQTHTIASGTLALPAQDPPRAGYPVDGAPIPIGGHLWAAGLQWSIDY